MPPGIRATVEFTSPELCPIVALSSEAETTIESVSVSACPSGRSECVTEFSVDAEHEPANDLDLISSHGSTRRYRLHHEGEIDCPCEVLGANGCPVDRYVAREGTLTLVFFVADYDQLRAVTAELRDRFPGVDLKRFVHSPTREPPTDRVFVDVSKLTTRQFEILKTAYEMGYFERPRRANATAVAAELDIHPSTFSEHLAAVQAKVFAELLEEGT